MARTSRKLNLSEGEKSKLISIIKKGTHKSRKITHAKALLLYDSGKSRLEMQSELGIDVNQYYRIKQRYFEGGLSCALEELPRSGQPSKLTDYLEAQITSIACSDSPDGTSRWTLRLINRHYYYINY